MSYNPEDYGMPGEPARSSVVPNRGVNREFDEYFDNEFGVDPDDDDADFVEMRRAAWATWRTEAPTAIPGRRDEEEDELARALALSRDEYQVAAFDRFNPVPGENAGSDEDEELQRAIALSTEEARAPKRQKREETPEEERRQLAEALAASLAAESSSSTPRAVPLQPTESDDAIEQANATWQKQREADRERQRLERASRNGTPNTGTPTPTATTAAGTSTAASTAKTSSAPGPSSSTNTTNGTSKLNGSAAATGKPNALLSDRAKMEAERLARQQARQTATGGGSGSATPDITPSLNTNTGSRPIAGSFTHAASSSATASSATSPSSLHPLQSTGRFPADGAGEYYPDGELRHSGLTIGNPTSEPTFSPEQVFGVISLIILSSFVLDDEWLSGIIPPPDKCPQIIIRPHPKDQPTWNGKVQAQPSGEVFCYPKMIGDWGSAHMKYIWIFYKTGRLRVVICTANFVPYDWDWIENSIFIQDFLPLPSPQPLLPSHLPHDLPLHFKYLFIHLKVHKALKYLIETHSAGAQIPFTPADSFKDMDKYDWSKLKVRVVMSVPGTYDGWNEMAGFGMCRLGQVLRDEGWRAGKGEKVVAEYQGSSLGQYGFEWFEQFYQFCNGRTPRELKDRPKPKEWAPLKIMYPSLTTVDASILGREGGGTMFVGKAWGSSVKTLFHHARSKRGGVLMHAKLIVATFEPQERSLGFEPVASSSSTSATGTASGKRKADDLSEEDGRVGGWIYVGSHNFSSAAWGTVNLKKATPTLNGQLLIYQIRNYELGIVFPLPRNNARKVADKVVPYVRPAEAYGRDDVPWDQKLHGSG